MEIDVDCANCATGRDLRSIGRRSNFFWGEMVDSLIGNGDFSGMGGNGISKKKEGFWAHARFPEVFTDESIEFQQGEPSGGK